MTKLLEPEIPAILISAYAICPGKGSEPGLGWNWISRLSEYFKVFVLTEAEFRDELIFAISQLPFRQNVKITFIDIGKDARERCWRQGDWLFYSEYKKWQRKAFSVAKNLVKDNNIKLIHQFNMIGFREPGYLWKISGVPFIWGPVGGAAYFPLKMISSLPARQALIHLLKNAINFIQLKYSPRVKGAARAAKFIVGANSQICTALGNAFDREIILLNETGCDTEEFSKVLLENSAMKRDALILNIAWVGHFVPRKQLGLALKIISKIKNKVVVKFHIVGSAFDKKTENYYKNMAKQLGILDVCEWYGNVERERVKEIIHSSDLMLFTSLVEGTPHVVLESLGCGTPVVCFNCCGQGDAIDNSCGRKIEVSTPSRAEEDFAAAIIELALDREALLRLRIGSSAKAKVLNWDGKISAMKSIYEKAIVIESKMLS